MDFVGTDFLKKNALVLLQARFTADDVIWNSSRIAFAPSLQSVLADVLPNTFPGYAIKAGSSHFFVYTVPGAGVTTIFAGITGFPQALWQRNAGGAPESAFGQYVQDGLTTELLCTSLYPAPVAVNASGDGYLADQSILNFRDSWLV